MDFGDSAGADATAAVEETDYQDVVEQEVLKDSQPPPAGVLDAWPPNLADMQQESLDMMALHLDSIISEGREAEGEKGIPLEKKEQQTDESKHTQ